MILGNIVTSSVQKTQMHEQIQIQNSLKIPVTHMKI